MEPEAMQKRGGSGSAGEETEPDSHCEENQNAFFKETRHYSLSDWDIHNLDCSE